MIIEGYLAFQAESNYALNKNPGIAFGILKEIWNCSTDETTRVRLQHYARHPFRLSVDVLTQCSLQQILIDIFHYYSIPCLFTGNSPVITIQYDDVLAWSEDIYVQYPINHMNATAEVIKVMITYSKMAGEVLPRDHDIRYIIHSHEGNRHHIPHVHVRIGDRELVLAIEDGRILAGNEHMIPNKKIRYAQRTILKNQVAVARYWNAATDGCNFLLDCLTHAATFE